MKSLSLLCVLFCSPALAQQSVSYDDFARLDQAERATLFSTMTAENRAAVARAQPERWLAVHRASLSPEQVGAVEGAIALMVPGLYDEAISEGYQAKFVSAVQRVHSLLPQEDFWAAFAPEAPYIPPPDRD